MHCFLFHDARHRVALRLLATWLDIQWKKVEAMEIMVACSVMALSKEQASKQEETQSPKSSWAKWKRGGIIGAAALTGGHREEEDDDEDRAIDPYFYM